MSFMDNYEHLNIQLKDIQAATNDFRDKPIGIGGFGAVYRGVLFHQKQHRVVAIKRLDRRRGQGDLEFWNEIKLLSKLKHKHLVTLLHFCREGEERILVYTYASRGSLDVYLGSASLTWTQRLNICIGVARGIAYLHDPKKTKQRVLHRDIKSANILLDDKWTAKVSDFGLSIIVPANQRHTSIMSSAVGTPGYCDPTYYETGILSKECDVYSFGVVLFEVMCGRSCCVYDKGKLKVDLVRNWRKCFQEKRQNDFIFPNLKDKIDQKSLLTFATIVNQCTDRVRKKRPSMDKIVKDLKLALNCQQKFRQPMLNIGVSYDYMIEFDYLKIQLEDIQLATNNFSSDMVIGYGGSGVVYKGELSLQEGQQSMVCFKCLDRRLGLGDVEFWNEIMLLSKCKHENVVSLLGFCNEGDERILSYEYASRGSLDRYLIDSSLTWTRRLKICLEVAHVLNYLHDPLEKQEGIIHGDIKSANILLDEKWTAKVCNFGLSTIASIDQMRTYLMTNAARTLGYCDPLTIETGTLSKESDLYSFGVLLLEVMSGRSCFKRRNGQAKLLVKMWRECYEKKTLDEIFFHDLKEQMEPGSLDAFSAIAYQCVEKFREERPTIAKIIEVLEIALERQTKFEELKKLMDSLAISPLSITFQNQPLTGITRGTLVGDGITKFYQHKVNVDKTPASYGFFQEFGHLKIRYKDIQSATNNFDGKKLLSSRGFGPVHKGELSLPEGQVTVACKSLDRRHGHGNLEFFKEIMTLSKYKHDNIISLLHFCDEHDNKIIVYEYSSRGSLDRYLSDPSLTWTQRLKICLGVAHALNFLHDPLEKNEGIIHRDIKSANILLDEKWTAKVCDFGLSKVVTPNQLQEYIMAYTAGTLGYCDPLYVEMALLSKESDVYSFGVVLFEVMCGRLCIDASNGQIIYLAAQWRNSYEEERLEEIVFHDLKEQMDPSSLTTFSAIACQCIKATRDERPTMADVIKELEIALEQQGYYEEMKRIENLVISPMSTTFPNQPLLRIPNGILVRDGKTWLSKNKNGTIWEIISAINCVSAKSLLPGSSENSRFTNVLRGVMHNEFSVKVKTRFLSQEIRYAVSLIFNHNGTNHGTHMPFKFKMDDENYHSDPCIPHFRQDGWLTIELCQFTSKTREHDYEIEFLPLSTVTSSNIEYFLEGIEFRPVEYVS